MRAEVEKSPHGEALELVLATQQPKIREVDKDDWWHDVNERAWAVKRPFHPGTIDSTHLFDVEYRIGERKVAHWFVDTRKRTVQLVVRKEPKGK